MVQLIKGPQAKDPSQRIRRNKTPGAIQLPAGGRSGATPEFPLGPDFNTKAALQVAESKLDDLEWKRAEGKKISNETITRAEERVARLRLVIENQRESELELWEKLWRTPQAVEWEALGWLDEAALYTRWMVLAASGDLSAGKEARQYADRLGLTPLAMARLRWEIAFDASQQSNAPTPPTSPPPDDGKATVTEIDDRRRRIAAG